MEKEKRYSPYFLSVKKLSVCVFPLGCTTYLAYRNMQEKLWLYNVMFEKENIKYFKLSGSMHLLLSALS
jgi:hypothetical protein